MQPRVSRRRFLCITAAAGAAAMSGAAAAEGRIHVWNGTALGARASLRLHHHDEREAQGLIGACIDEIGRLERIFSLYRPDSALCRLNDAGHLDAPPLDLVRLLDLSRTVARLTDGAFDPTVQPLWVLLARHFVTEDADPAGPGDGAIAAARKLVDYRDVRIEPDRLALRRAGMAITLNGIAQGYVTDRVAELLRTQGLDHVLIDLGETRAIGGHPSGRPWRAGIADPADKARIVGEIDLVDRALATSAPAGFLFTGDGKWHHLLDPRTGRPESRYASITVAAPDATTADALSTAFMQMDPADIAHVRGKMRDITVHLLHVGGAIQRVG